MKKRGGRERDKERKKRRLKMSYTAHLPKAVHKSHKRSFE